MKLRPLEESDPRKIRFPPGRPKRDWLARFLPSSIRSRGNIFPARRVPPSPGPFSPGRASLAALPLILFLWQGPSFESFDPPQVQFVDVAAEAGIDFIHTNGRSSEKLLVETFGSGLAWLDYDRDGFLDLYFVNGADLTRGEPSPGNALFRNQGNGTFRDVTREAGVAGTGAYGMGVAVGDYDNDGFQDLYVTYYGPNLLYRNNGDGTFRDVTARADVAGGSWSSSAGFFDYDRDGDLDLYVVNYLDYDLRENRYCGRQEPGYRSYCDPWTFDGALDQLYRNNGDGTFTEVSRQAGIANPGGKGLGVTFADLDQDGHVDIYVANDTTRNFLYRNLGNGRFQDVTYGAGVGYDPHGKPQAGMGTDCADADGDGLLDLFVTNFSEESNNLYRNLGDLVFEDIASRAGLDSGFLPLGFGTQFFDYDNDGDADLYVANGHVVDNIHLYKPHLSYAQEDRLYQNGGRGDFSDVSSRGGAPFQVRKVGRGTAAADFDNDGDLDLAVSNSGDRPMLLKNEGGHRNHWLLIQARGHQSNRFGLGTRVRLQAGGQSQLKEISPVDSYLSSSDFRLHFGLGREAVVERVEIHWPSGIRQVLTGIAAGQVLLVEEPKPGTGQLRTSPAPMASAPGPRGERLRVGCRRPFQVLQDLAVQGLPQGGSQLAAFLSVFQGRLVTPLAQQQPCQLAMSMALPRVELQDLAVGIHCLSQFPSSLLGQSQSQEAHIGPVETQLQSPIQGFDGLLLPILIQVSQGQVIAGPWQLRIHRQSLSVLPQGGLWIPRTAVRLPQQGKKGRFAEE